MDNWIRDTVAGLPQESRRVQVFGLDAVHFVQVFGDIVYAHRRENGTLLHLRTYRAFLALLPAAALQALGTSCNPVCWAG